MAEKINKETGVSDEVQKLIDHEKEVENVDAVLGYDEETEDWRQELRKKSKNKKEDGDGKTNSE